MSHRRCKLVLERGLLYQVWLTVMEIPAPDGNWFKVPLLVVCLWFLSTKTYNGLQ